MMRLATNDSSLAPGGVFTAIEPVAPGPGLALGQRLAGLAQQADRRGCAWLFHRTEGEQAHTAALDRAALATLRYDAIFGALAVGAQPALWRPSRLAFDDQAHLPHALLHWWVGHTLLARTGAMLALAEAGRLDGTSDIETLFTLWSAMPCVKLAQALSRQAQEPPALAEADRAAVLERLAHDPARMGVQHGEERYVLPYTGRNAGIERAQTRGQFFEQEELSWLRQRLGPGRVVADIGANTGNHTVYFAGPMQARRVIPFEPMPEAADMLVRAVGWNHLSNVDLSLLRHGVGAAPARMRAERSERGGLGATRLVADAAGSIAVAPLDALLTTPVDFLKIDVESMEMEVLAGAAGVIARNRPLIFIEVAEATADAFRQWLAAHDYGVERIFSDKGHTNLLVSPRPGA